jgi:hypothetical protein
MEDDDDNELTVNLIQRRFVQPGFDYTRENKCQPLFAERGKLYYTLSAKHTVVAYETTTTHVFVSVTNLVCFIQHV